MNNIQRIRIKEPKKHLIQMHRNTRIDPHTLNFLKNITINKLHRYPIIDPFKQKYASFLNTTPNNFLLTSGIDGVVKYVIKL